MGVSGKLSRITSIVAAVCIAIYIMAIAFGAAQIIDSVGERRNFAEKEFYDIADKATSSAVFLGFMSDAYRESISDFLGASDTLLGIIITGSSGEYGFERSPGSGIVWAGESPRFKTGAGFPREPLTLFLRIEGQRNVTIRAIYGCFDFHLVVNVLKNTLAAVLVSLIIAFTALIIEITLKNKNSARAGVSTIPESSAAGVSDSDESETGNGPDEYDDFFKNDDSGESGDSDEGSEFATFDESGAAFDESGATVFDKSETAFDDENGGEADEPDLPFTEDEETDIIFEDADLDKDSPRRENPQGLYSPRGNIGWESYTRDRLDSELHRCASFEQDLTFMAMAFRDIENHDDAQFRRFADEVVNFFTARDLIFEKGGDGISIIIPNAELEECISRAEEFRGRIMGENPGFSGEELCIGLSSRSGRLVEADRVMLEAYTALEKARKDPLSPVVAFKSDLEKYREYIKGRAR